MDDISHVKGSGDIFLDLWFSPEEAENLSVTSAPIGAIGDTIDTESRRRALRYGSDDPVEGFAGADGERDD